MIAVYRRWPQILRKSIQLGVLAFMVYAALGGAWRNYKTAHNHRRLVTMMEGETWGTLYGLHEDALARFGEPYEMSTKNLGIPWASRVAGLDGADPVMVTAHLTATGSITGDLLLGLLLPLGLALLLGKVFCSYLCPMRLVFEIGQMVRAGLDRIGVTFPELRVEARFGFWVLLGGILATLSVGTVAWFFILPYLALSTTLFLYVATGVSTTIILVAGVWLFIDMFLAPGLWCRNLCPTGFILEQFGRLSLLQLRKRTDQACPERCNQCQRACPYGLLPKEETHRPTCDNCGQCVVACPTRALSRRVRLPVLSLVLVGVITILSSALFPSAAQAHHNKGLPHYGYFENYPQVPTEEYVVIRGKWEFGATFFNFQGLDRRNADTPNDVKIYAYLYDLDADAAYRGAVDFEIRQHGERISRFERLEVDEEAVYSTRETLPETGDYQLVAVFDDGHEVSLDFHIDLDAGGINWLLIVGIGGPVLLVFFLAYLGRSRKKRRPRSKPPRAVASTAVGLCLCLCLGLGLGSFGNMDSAHADEPIPTTPAAMTSEPGYASDLDPGDERGRAGGDADFAPRGHRTDAVHDESTGEVCPYCGMIDCTMEHVETEDGSAVMIMVGIPLWLFLGGVVGLLLLSFVGTEWLSRRVGKGFRIDLMRNRRIYRMVRSRWFQAVPQLFMVVVLGGLIYVGLFGSRVANLTPIAVWTIWWGGLIFTVLVLGSMWCFVCPWDGIANLLSRLRLAARVDTLGLDLPFPGWLKNVYPAIVLFALLTWLELGFGVTTDPRATAYMGLGMASLAVVFALLFDGKKFCAHACPVGRICGIYSTVAPIEIRARKERTCQACRTEDCRNGNEFGYPCPTGLSLKTIESSTMCTMCTECVKSCHKQNISFNLRPFGADLRILRTPRLDEAWLALVLLSLTLFHGLTMTPVWEDFRPGESSLLEWMALTLGTAKVWNFSLAMVLVCAVPVGFFWLACRVAARCAGHGVGTTTLFRHFAYSLLPVALFYHLAHNLMHLLMEGGHVVPLLSDPMGDGSDYLGTSGAHLGHLTSETTMWFMQVGLILIGHIFGIVVAHRIGHKLYPTRRAALISLVPMLLMMIVISVGGLYLMHLDMNMRVGRM